MSINDKTFKNVALETGARCAEAGKCRSFLLLFATMALWIMVCGRTESAAGDGAVSDLDSLVSSLEVAGSVPGTEGRVTFLRLRNRQNGQRQASETVGDNDGCLNASIEIVEAPDDEYSISRVVVKNITTTPVVLRRGMYLRGGDQDRVVLEDRAIGPRESVQMAVYCVEQGRELKKDGGDGARFEQVTSDEPILFAVQRYLNLSIDNVPQEEANEIRQLVGVMKILLLQEELQRLEQLEGYLEQCVAETEKKLCQPAERRAQVPNNPPLIWLDYVQAALEEIRADAMAKKLDLFDLYMSFRSGADGERDAVMEDELRMMFARLINESLWVEIRRLNSRYGLEPSGSIYHAFSRIKGEFSHLLPSCDSIPGDAVGLLIEYPNSNRAVHLFADTDALGRDFSRILVGCLHDFDADAHKAAPVAGGAAIIEEVRDMLRATVFVNEDTTGNAIFTGSGCVAAGGAAQAERFRLEAYIVNEDVSLFPDSDDDNAVRPTSSNQCALSAR